MNKAGVLTIETQGKGTIVINKQPPNRQLWLASPVTGPMRFDWVVSGESMHEKEGAGTGSWVYLRDGTTLNSLLKKEVGVDMEHEEIEVGQIVEKGAHRAL
jgi:frataxin